MTLCFKLSRSLVRPRPAFAALLACTSLSLSMTAIAAEPTSAEAATAAAPSPEAVAEAGQRYDRGLKLYSEGEYRLAVIEFERTYELVPDYRVLYNIGQVRIQLGDYARARLALERYLKDGAGQIAPQREAAVKGDLDMLEGRTATLRIQVNVAGAEVLVDGETVGTAPLPEPILMNAGDHTVEVRKAGYRPRQLRRTLAGKDAGELSVELDEIQLAPSTPVVVVPSTPVAPRRNMTPVVAGWATTGALTAGAIVTGILGLKAADKLDQMKEDAPAHGPDLDSQKNKAKMLMITGDALGAAAVVAGSISLYLTLRTPGPASAHRDTASLGLAFTPSEVRLVGRY